MKHFRISRFLSILVAGVCVAAPASSFADRKVKVYRDLDGDGHFNKKTYNVGRGHHRDHHGHGYNRGNYGYGRGYGYGGRGYRYGGRGYGHGGYGYGSPYGYGSGYGYGSYYGYARPSIGVSLYSSPSYYTRERYTTYRSQPRSSSYDNELSVEVQQALKRRGYYRGSIDGDIGPGSRSAIRSYQADRGLSVTGRIDSSLLRALGIG